MNFGVGVSEVLPVFYCNLQLYKCVLSLWQVELEKLNSATDEINKLEKELDVSLLSFVFHSLFTLRVLSTILHEKCLKTTL